MEYTRVVCEHPPMLRIKKYISCYDNSELRVEKCEKCGLYQVPGSQSENQWILWDILHQLSTKWTVSSICKMTNLLEPHWSKPPEKALETVNHPAHYGGEDNIYEAIKVIEAWGLGFNIGNCIKYLSRAGKKGDALTDYKKAKWYLEREIVKLEREGK